MTQIVTRRLVLRPYLLSDAEVAFGWLGDPNVMRFATATDTSVKATEDRIARYITHQAQHGFSKWIVIDKSSGTAIGDGGIQLLPDMEPLPDLGFRLCASVWGRGFGTEIALGWCRKAIDLGLPPLGAFAHVENVASQRVLEKVGFQRLARQVVRGLDSFTYRFDLSNVSASTHDAR